MVIKENSNDEECRNIAEKLFEEYEEQLLKIRIDDGKLTVLTDTKIGSKPILNSMCKTVEQNSDSTWGLVISSGPNNENVLIFVKDADDIKGVFQMYAMVFGIASNVVASTRINDVEYGMDFEDVAELISDTSPETPSQQEVLKKIK